jgi:glyoxylase-like metal-dependent hydrolase (beta-lactamase superfamily II)
LNRIIFTGDTVFIGGCGKFFEGDASGMLYAMDTL